MTSRILVMAGGAAEAEALRALLEEAGHQVIVAASSEDALEHARRESLDALTSAESFRSLFLHNPNAIFSVDPDGTFTGLNPAAVALTGYDPAELIGTSFAPIVVPEDLPRVREHFANALQGEPQLYETTILRRDGRRVELSVINVPVVVAGRPVGVYGIVEDITARKRAQQEVEQAWLRAEEHTEQLSELASELEGTNQELAEALEETREARVKAEEAEEEQRAVLTAMQDVVIVLDHEGRYVKIPPAAPNLLYRPPADLVGKRMHDVLPEADADAFLSAVRQALETRSPVTVEYALPIGEEVVWFSGVASPMAEDRVVWVARDITSRKQAEERLRASEERYRLVFDANPLPMWIYDRRTLRFLMVNTAAMEQYGYTREEFDRLTITDIRPAEDVPRFRDAVSRQETGLHRSGGWRHRAKDGRVFDVQIIAHPVRIDGYDAELVLALDVSDRVRAEQALQESEQRLRTLVAAAPIGIILLDWSLRARRWNPGAQEIFGWSGAEVLGKPLPFAADEHSEEFEQRRSELERGETLSQIEVQRVRKDGTTVEISYSAAPLKAQDGTINGFVAVVVDITRRRELEGQLRHAQKMEAVGQLAGGIAHDFNNLLTVIKGNAELLLWELGAEHSHPEIEEISQTADRATNLTRQLLTFSRKQVTELRVFPINSVVLKTEQLLRRLLGEHIELVSLLAPDAGSIRADLGQMEQVLVNLAVNARDAMPTGGRLTIATSRVRREMPAGAPPVGGDGTEYVLLTVSDTGSGIPPEIRERVFEPFFTTKPTGSGTGLGLSTVYGIVKQAGGDIELVSEVARGTAFEIYLPGVEEVEATAGRPARRPVSGSSGMILLVEDEASVRHVTRRMLERYGYTVHVAEGGREALGLLREFPGELDLVITDVVMPGTSGPAVAALARERFPGVGSSRVDLQACKLEYSIVSPK